MEVNTVNNKKLDLDNFDNPDGFDGFDLKITRISDEEVQRIAQMAGGLQDGIIYIMPESRSKEFDLLNKYSADLKKFAAKENITCELVHGNEYKYLELKDSDVILPFTVSFSASAVYDLIKSFITRSFPRDTNNLQVKINTKRKKNLFYEKIEISGKPEGVLKALELLKNDESGSEA